MGIDVEIARFLIKAPAAVKLVFEAVAQHPLPLLKPAPLISGVIPAIGIFGPQISERQRVRRRQARGVLRQRIQGEAGFTVGLPCNGRGDQIIFIAAGVRLIVILRRLTQQAVIPVAVGNLSGRIEVAFFQITVPGVKTDLGSGFPLRLFALNIYQPARRTAAVKDR